jgi:predicted phage terminase large subunit-like protein
MSLAIGWEDVLAAAGERHREEVQPRFPTPGALAAALYPATVQTPALQAIDEAVKWAYETPDARLIISMPPQEGKSTRVTICGALWFLIQDPDLRVAIASYNQDLANEFGRFIRDHISTNSGQDDSLDLGLRIRPDNGAVSSWRLNHEHIGGVRSVGLASGLTGRPADALFIDDPIANMEQAESIKYRERAWNFWLTVGSTRLAKGAPVIVILTRWHHDDLAGRLVAAEDGHKWRVLNIPAQADHKLEEGEADPLGREPGEYMVSARGRTPADWDAIKIRSGPRVWSALYQGHPSPLRGGIFCDDWPEYDTPIWAVRKDGSRWVPGLRWPDMEICQSWDMAFKDLKTSDWVVGQVWLRRGVDCFLLDQVRGRMSFTKTIEAFEEMTAKWPQAVQKFIEDKANGPAVISALKRKIPGMIPIEPEGSKYARAVAISPFTHSSNVILPAPLAADGTPFAPWVSEFKHECQDFPNGANDDQVDAMSQALNRLLLAPLLEEGIIEPDEFTSREARGWSISPV